jgi:hypothetical protein
MLVLAYLASFVTYNVAVALEEGYGFKRPLAPSQGRQVSKKLAGDLL